MFYRLIPEWMSRRRYVKCLIMRNCARWILMFHFDEFFTSIKLNICLHWPGIKIAGTPLLRPSISRLNEHLMILGLKNISMTTKSVDVTSFTWNKMNRPCDELPVRILTCSVQLSDDSFSTSTTWEEHCCSNFISIETEISRESDVKVRKLDSSCLWL